MNCLIMAGRLVKDPINRTLKEGGKVVTFSLAVNSGKRVTYLDCLAFDEVGELVMSYCKKASFIIIEGSLIIRPSKINPSFKDTSARVSRITLTPRIVGDNLETSAQAPNNDVYDDDTDNEIWEELKNVRNS